MSNDYEREYYIKKKKLLLRQFDFATSIAKEAIEDYFGELKTKELLSSARQDFEMLIPQIPYVGGNENRLTGPLVNSALILPLIRAFNQKGLSFDEIGNITYNIFEAFFAIIPPEEDIFTEEYMSKVREDAERSKLREYPGDWVFDYVEGDGKTFTFGINYHECGVYKFYKSQGLEKYMPIVCIADFAQAKAYGYGLWRTQNIANGSSICDFRYVKDGTSARAWPIYDLPEFKKREKL